MTNPNDPSWGQQPDNPGQWQQPQYGQPQYGQPQYGQQSQYGQYGQPQYGQQQPGAGQWDEPLQQPPARHGSSRGKAIAFGAAAVVVLGGGIATYAAVSSSSGSGGSSSPKAAVQRVFTDLGNSDLIGLLDDLPPGERAAISTPFKDSISQLERVGVLKHGADLNHLSGISIKPANLTYAAHTIPVNDHVQIVQLTGGTMTVDADATKLPLASDLLRLVESNASGSPRVHRVVNIAQAVKAKGGPIRIAAQQVGGSWYPSLMYTIADNAAHAAGLGTPSPADRIAPHGASSPDDAVRDVVDDLLAGNVRQAIALTSPDEDAVLHDYGAMIANAVHYSPAPVKITSLQFTDTTTSDGTQVGLKSLAITENGQSFSMTLDGKCVEFRGGGQDQRICPSALRQELQGSGLPFAVIQAMMHVSTGEKASGVLTTQVDGQWYVNPVQSIFGVVPTFLSALHPGDITNLIRLGH